MMLRKVSSEAKLVSFDISHEMTMYSDSWMHRAGLSGVAYHFCMDSTDPLTRSVAGSVLDSAPQLLFIDASKQYQNTLQEIELWAPYINGFVMAHDVSAVAISEQSNTSLGVGDALTHSPHFGTNQVLVLDPRSEYDEGFPYIDPNGVGIGLLRGREPLPRPSGMSAEDLLEARAIVPNAKLDDLENWFLDACFELIDGALVKSSGIEGFARCFAPMFQGQRLKFTVEIVEFGGDGVVVCGGGDPGSSSVVKGIGLHRGEFRAGNQNSYFAVYGSAATTFRLQFLEVVGFEVRDV